MPARRRLKSPVPSKLPLLLEWWTDLEGAGRSVNTRLAYIRDVAEFAAYVDGNLEGALPEDLVRFTRRLTEAGFATATRARKITGLRQFYEWLRRRQQRPFSVALELRPPRRTKRVHRWWTEEQVARFRAAFEGEHPRVLRDRAMAELGLMGLRVSEVTRLDIERVIALSDPERAGIVVWRKGGKEQVLPLTADARAALIRWLYVRPTVATTALFFRMPFQPQRPRLRYASLERIFKQYAARAKVPVPEGIAFHHLRHTAGQQMANVGLGIEEAQRLLGHESPVTTQVYYEVTDARLRRAVRRLRYGDGRASRGLVPERGDGRAPLGLRREPKARLVPERGDGRASPAASGRPRR